MKRAKPIGTYVLVHPYAEERKTDSGIIIPDIHAGGDRKGVIEEQGEGNRWNNMDELRKGDIVTFGRNSGIEVPLPNESGEIVTYLLLDYKQLIYVE